MGTLRQTLWERFAEYLGRYGEHIAEYGWLDPISSIPMVPPAESHRQTAMWSTDDDLLFRWWSEGEEPAW